MDFGALLKMALPKFVLIVGQRESLPENREEKEPPSSLSDTWERFNSVGCLAWRRLLVVLRCLGITAGRCDAAAHPGKVLPNLCSPETCHRVTACDGSKVNRGEVSC